MFFQHFQKNEGVLLLLRRLTKNILIYVHIYIYIFLFNLWLNCSTILTVIDHQQLTVFRVMIEVVEVVVP